MSTRKTIPTPAQPSKPSPDNLSPLKAIEPPNPNPNQPTTQGTPPLKELVKQYDSVSLLLQGGGALGAYQAGIYEGLHKQGIKIDRISGISIGALNTAIIAGTVQRTAWRRCKGFGTPLPIVTTPLQG